MQENYAFDSTTGDCEECKPKETERARVAGYVMLGIMCTIVLLAVKFRKHIVIFFGSFSSITDVIMPYIDDLRDEIGKIRVKAKVGRRR